MIVHHYPERWIGGQVDRLRGKRVIWRTCGQSNPDLERLMIHLRAVLGMEIVRYSPAEERGFGPMFAGCDAVIRFAKYPSDYGPWDGDLPVVGNLTQDMKGRGAFTGFAFWREATEGLPVRPAGLRSEEIGGIGLLPYEAMLGYLRSIRVMLYTGTVPASYTLALMEAMLSGTPVLSIGPSHMPVPLLFEGHEIAGNGCWYDDPLEAREVLRSLLADRTLAGEWSRIQRFRALELFSVAKVGPLWKALLG